MPTTLEAVLRRVRPAIEAGRTRVLVNGRAIDARFFDWRDESEDRRRTILSYNLGELYNAHEHEWATWSASNVPFGIWGTSLTSSSIVELFAKVLA